MTAPAERSDTEVERASTLELFLDLVFVFTVTQLTELVSHPHGFSSYGEAALILLITWWMYDGYVWLTGNIRMDSPLSRLAIFAGMAGFLLMALAIPGVFEEGGVAGDSALVFGLAYTGVVVLHMLMFSTAPNSSAQAIRRIAPFNLGGATLVLVAAFVSEEWRWMFWLAAVIVMLSSSLFGRLEGWSVSPTHFIERHGLVIIVALGESVVAIGVGAAGLPVDGSLAATAVLALALSAAMWWVYFDRDDEEAATVMVATHADHRSQLGLWIAYAHVVMIAGIIVTAAGITSILSHPTEPSETAAAWNLAIGLAVYLLGEAYFRFSLGLGPPFKRLLAAALMLLTVPIGLALSGMAQLAATFALLVLLLVGESLRYPAPAVPSAN
jgi:low temperature requirement protein LtrA